MKSIKRDVEAAAAVGSLSFCTVDDLIASLIGHTIVNPNVSPFFLLLYNNILQPHELLPDGLPWLCPKGAPLAYDTAYLPVAYD
jgi:hypothetical protein